MDTSINAMAQAAGGSRDRVVDFVRAVSLLVVAIGHWLLAAVWIDADGGLTAGHLLALEPSTQVLTLGAQVITVFMVAGGFANAISWTGHRQAGGRYGSWLAGRARRLLGPTVPFVVLWAAVTAAVAAFTDVDSEMLTLATQVVSIPVWFLATFFVIVALAPAAHAAHVRWRLGALGALAGAMVAVEVLSRGLGMPVIGWAQFVLVWGLVAQLGFFWQDGSMRAAGPRLWWTMAAGGAATLWVLIDVAGWYPLSMVGVPGADQSNNSPASAALAVLGVTHLGLIMLAYNRLERLLALPAVWKATVAAGVVAMSVYLAHSGGMVVAIALAAMSPWADTLLAAEPASGAWWATRPLWFVVYAVATAPMVVLFVRFEKATVGSVGRLRTARVSAVSTVAGAAAMCVSMGMLAASGFHVPGTPAGLPLPALACMAVGLVLLHRAVTPDRHAPVAPTATVGSSILSPPASSTADVAASTRVPAGSTNAPASHRS